MLTVILILPLSLTLYFTISKLVVTSNYLCTVMLKYAGEYCEYGEPYGEAGDACQSLVAVIRSRDAGVK